MASISVSDIGIDALMPVVVATPRSTTIRLFGTYSIDGCFSRSSFTEYQCVVPRLLSSSPAAATTVAPTQTPITVAPLAD